jgi:hypothetical protein
MVEIHPLVLKLYEPIKEAEVKKKKMKAKKQGE